jgi:hypothetical protein
MRALAFAVFLLFCSSLDADIGACDCIFKDNPIQRWRSASWTNPVLLPNYGRTPVDNVFSVCLEEQLPINECPGDAECEVPKDNAYEFDDEVITFVEAGTYVTNQEWDIQCSDDIYPDSSRRARLLMMQKGDLEINEVGDTSDDAIQCEVTFTPVGYNEQGVCRSWFNTNLDDSDSDSGLCLYCKDACDDCDGDWTCFGDDGPGEDCGCTDTDDAFFISYEVNPLCPQVCEVFEINAPITRTFTLTNSNCTEMTTDWYGATFTYVPGSASSLTLSLSLAVVVAVFGLIA